MNGGQTKEGLALNGLKGPPQLNEYVNPALTSAETSLTPLTEIPNGVPSGTDAGAFSVPVGATLVMLTASVRVTTFPFPSDTSTCKLKPPGPSPAVTCTELPDGAIVVPLVLEKVPHV